MWEKPAGRIKYEVKEFGSNDFKPGDFRFASGFQEMAARDFAMNSAIEEFKPDWIISLDGDEVVNSRFWEHLDVLDDSEFDTFMHSTSLPINFYWVSQHPLDMQEVLGRKLFDPHIRAWRPNLNGKWVPNYDNLNIHGHLVWNREPKMAITSDTVHFHLHYSFGPKSLYSYFCQSEQTAQNAAKILDMPVEEIHNQKYFEKRWPERFENGRFIPPKVEDNLLWNKLLRFSIPMNHPLPDYVRERWIEWGDTIV